MNRNFILADNQELTKAGVLYALSQNKNIGEITDATDKKELLDALKRYPDAVVVIDYNYFDFSDVSELLNLKQRFDQSFFIVLSEGLTVGFLKAVIYKNDKISILFKNTGTFQELAICISSAINNHRYVSGQALDSILHSQSTSKEEKDNVLTSTEKAILEMIARGKTTKEIASERHVSFHTIISHRKNIFRKLDVNNIHEATKYAIRVGLVNFMEYNI